MVEEEYARFEEYGVVGVAPRSATGRSLGDDPGQLLRHPVTDFLPPPGVIDRLADAYAREGLRVEARTGAGLTVAGENALLAEVFGNPVRPVRNKYIRGSVRYETKAAGPLRSRVLPGLVDEVRVPASGFELAASATPPPSRTDRYLRLPEDAVRVAGAAPLHAAGIRGEGVRVVMVDTGLYPHPHHRAHGYRTSVVPALPVFDPAVDERGHGTAMSALLLAVAPRVELTMVKMANESFSFPLVAFQRAVQLAPDVLSCSWGTLRAEPRLHLEVADAVRRGVTVLFAAGNGSTDRPTAMFQSVATPGALTVGGAHQGPGGVPRASDLASSYRSAVFPGRSVPDLSGPCGLLPNGDYIVFPTQPGCLFDRRNSAYDGTAPDDGWLVSSGTSGATAYAAGVVALAVQQGVGRGRALRAEDLAGACLPVTEGVTSTGDDCGGVCPNEAVGLGLLTAGRLRG
ncbi:MULTISPECIES: S8 family serine peptidase [unclassified Streptomyces]|uniref:S8 family serine peptidase n=1 Tax=unclassified Streptomyces TaxID=2593676 RepID=UPI001660550C|nr:MULTISPECIES: S8 family serine peptidase [unclassified Streptomyces]MBD0709045.1 peptidase S8 and S53, subtilisin, kexin,sedolisin [Streptomyces sp. CBMA291]MBD0715383.1 peptidase S8 and S53, subtilisin, kexin,sedolisin [Streptomyces sp. CBMA370]